VLCPNVTTATNTVLHNLVWEEGDVIVYTSGVYGALEKTIDYVVESTPARSVKVELDLPRGDDEILDLFKETLRREKERAKRDPKKRDPKIVAVFDTIVSMPGLLMPFERLVRLCREEGVMSLVDAAHGVGQIPLNLSDLDPDFLVTNCHKWLFVPRSVAAFYVARRNQHLIRTTLPTSHGFRSAQKEGAYDPMPASSETNDFVRQFEYFGTIDGAPYCCIEGALDFRDRVCGGEAAIRTYCTDLARRAERILVDRLGTESFNIPETHRVFFAHVRLPITVGDANSGCDVPKGDVDTVTQFMNKEFVDTYRTFLYLLFYRGAWWARLSATVYVDIRDCEYAARVLEDLSEMVRKGAYRAADPASRK
jgi:selenocysteine lyase/cysteine desulfurase